MQTTRDIGKNWRMQDPLSRFSGLLLQATTVEEVGAAMDQLRYERGWADRLRLYKHTPSANGLACVWQAHPKGPGACEPAEIEAAAAKAMAGGNSIWCEGPNSDTVVVPIGVQGKVLGVAILSGVPQESTWEDGNGTFMAALEMVSLAWGRIAAEGERRAEVARFKAVVEDQSELICRFDTKGILTFVNDAYCRYFGKTPEELIGHSFFPLVPAEDQPRIDEAIAGLCATAPTVMYEHRVILASGDVRWNQWTDHVLCDIDGTIREYQSVGRDVTDLMNLHEALRQNDKQWRSVAEMLPDVIYLYDTISDTVLYANPAFETVFGRTRQAVMQSASVLRDSIYPGDQEGVAAQRKAGVGTTTAAPLDYRIVRPDGTLRWIQEFCFPIRFGDADRQVVCGVARDVTQQRYAHQRLRSERDLAVRLATCSDLEEALQTVLDAALQVYPADSGGIYLVREELHKLVLVGHRGLTPDFVDATSTFDLEGPQGCLVRKGTAVFEPYDGRLAQGATGADVRVSEGLMAVGVVPIAHNGRVIAVLNIGSHCAREFPLDTQEAYRSLAAQFGGVLARLEAEKALRQSRENLQTLFDSLGDFLFVLGPEGHIISANPVVTSRLGYELSELMGLHVLAVHPPERHAETLGIVQAMLEGTRIYCPVPLVAKNGTFVPVETRVTQGRWDGSDALFGISRDISERIKAQEELARAHDALEDRVKERTSELQQVNRTLRSEVRAREQAEQKLRDNQERLRTLASELLLAEERERRRIAVEIHDRLGQSLALARIRLDLAASLEDQERATQIRTGVTELIDRAIEHAQTLTFELSPPMLYEMGLGPALEWLAEETFQHGTTRYYVKRPTEEPKLTEEQRLLLYHFARELLANVVKHASASSVTLTLKAGTRALSLSVADDGIGFDLRASASEKTRKGGFGLFSIRERVTRVGGKCVVDSAPGAGTRVRVEIPRKQEVV